MNSEQQNKSNNNNKSQQSDQERDAAAVKIQALTRGFAAKKKANQEKNSGQ